MSEVTMQYVLIEKVASTISYVGSCFLICNLLNTAYYASRNMSIEIVVFETLLSFH